MRGRPLYLGEGLRDVGAPSNMRRRVPCEHEGDLPRLVRRIAELLNLETRFGYDASTFREMITRAVVRDGRPTRVGGKSKELRDAIVYALTFVEPTPSAVIALLDARARELPQLQRDAADILAQCRERRADVPVVIGIALHEVEIWMLADPEARVAAFGEHIGRASLPELPAEDIGDPKQLWATYAGRIVAPEGVSSEDHGDALRRAAWQALRPLVVAQACPRGFAPFQRELQPMLRAFLG